MGDPAIYFSISAPFFPYWTLKLPPAQYDEKILNQNTLFFVRRVL